VVVEGEQKGVPIDIVAGLNAMDAERGRAVDLETPSYGAPDIMHDRLTELHSEIREKGDQSSKDLMDIVDFTKYADLQAFQKDMQEAYGYIATHIKYMNDARALKQQRGFYGGGSLPAPYVIDRSVWKDDQKPRIYHPWLEPALDLFVRFRAFDFSIAHICRYIESKPYIFKVPSELDQQRYMFLSRMHLFHGGYKFSDMGSVKEWLSNLTLGGYAKVGKDEEGNILYMPNAFEAGIYTRIQQAQIQSATINASEKLKSLDTYEKQNS
jgi:hypothetical protein